MNTKSMVMMLASALLAGCSAQMDGMPGGDDTGSGSGGGDGGPTGMPGAYFVESTVRDERADMLTFTADGPVHAHVGAPITLGGSDCPTVHKHVYLMDQAAPRYGRELTPNPLVWQLALEAADQLDLASSTYRVRTGGDVVLLDWTPVPAADGATLAIPMYRRGDASIPALGEYAGKVYVDVRTVALDGAENTVSACWDHQPLAAPLEIERPRPATMPGLVSTTFTGTGGAGTVASVVSGSTTMPTLATRITHYTAEPVQVDIDVSGPTATHASRIVDDYVESARSGVGYNCGPDDPIVPNTDPRCDQSPLPDPADVSRAGALAATRWSATLVDAATGIVVETCTASSELRVNCTLPARAADAPPRSYRLVVAGRSFAELFPPATTIAYHLLATQPYVGTPRAGAFRCKLMRLRQQPDGSFAQVCFDNVEYARIFALDRSTVTVAPVSVAVQTAPTPALPLVPAANVSSDPLTWDTGNADLPGAQ